MNHLKYLIMGFAFSATVGELLGQENGFAFTCASWERVEGSPIYYLAGKPVKNETPEAKLKRLKKVDTPEMTRSERSEFKSGQTISFYRKISNEGGAVALQEVATSKIPDSWENVLFVFFPTEKEGRYHLYPLRDDRTQTPYGSYQFVNLTGDTITGFLDKNEITLKPKKTAVIVLKGEESRPLNFGVWTVEDGKRKWLMRNTLTYKPTKYLVYFFYGTSDRMGRKKLKSKGIVAFEPPPVEVGAEDRAKKK